MRVNVPGSWRISLVVVGLLAGPAAAAPAPSSVLTCASPAVSAQVNINELRFS